MVDQQKHFLKYVFLIRMYESKSIPFFFSKKSDVKLFHRMWTYMQQSADVFVASNEEGINKVR